MRQVQVNKNLILREDGRLFNIKTGEEYTPYTSGDGYYRLGHAGRKYLLHRLVMEFFGPPSPGPNYQVDHINQNKLDNNINNLRWVTRSENCRNKTNNLPAGQRYGEISDKEYNTAKQARWRNKHRDNCRKNARKYRKKNKDKIKAANHKWYSTHKDYYKKKNQE